MKNSFDIISIGDATLDTFIEIESATVTCQLHKRECLLCMNYADKIPIRTSQKQLAGNAANNAVGSARLGMRAAFWTIIGDDDTRDLLFKTMKKEKVSCEYVKVQKKSESNYAVVLNFKGERTQLIYRLPRKYDVPNRLAPSQWVYLTAMGPNHQLAYDELLAYIVKNDVQLAYNPGKEQIDCNLKKCVDLFSFTKILFVNKEEAQMILNTSESDIVKLLKKLKALGPQIVVITDGSNGSYALNGGQTLYCPILDVQMVEMTGAGDSYATAFIAALFHHQSLEEAMVWGSLNSWSVVQYIGPQKGLLTLAKIKKLRQANNDLEAVLCS